MVPTYCKYTADRAAQSATSWAVWGPIPGGVVGGQIFSSRSDRPCGSPSLLYNMYRVFLGGKAAGAWSWPPTTSWRQSLNYSCTCTVNIEICQNGVQISANILFTLQSSLNLYARSQNCEKRLLVASCLSVRPSVCPHGKTGLPLDGVSWNLMFDYFTKIYRENSSFITTSQ